MLINEQSNRTARSLYYSTNIESLPICHSWIITAHVSLGNLKIKWRMLVQHMGRKQQLLNPLQQKPLAPTYMILALQTELTNLDSIYTSYKPLTLMETKILRMAPTFDGILPLNKHTRRNLLPFLGDVLNWLTRTATAKDVRHIKSRVN